MGFFKKLKKAVKFENFGVKRLIKGIKKNPTVLLTDPAQTPLGTKLHNTIFGTKLKPLTNQMGGHSSSAYTEYGKDPGIAPQMNQVAGAIAGFYAGGALSGAASSGASSLGASQGTANLAGQAASRGAMAAGAKANEAGAVSSPGNAPSSGGNGSTMPNQPKNSTYTGKDAWFVNPARGALDRATELADRPYTPYTGTRIASLSDNEVEAGNMARSYSSRYQPQLDRLSGGYNAGALQQFENPYLDSVLNDRVRRIGEDYTTQASALDRNAAATDAFRTGRSDKARARLASSRMRAVDEATNAAKSDAFLNAQNAYFQQGAQDLNTIGAIQSGQNSQIDALNRTGAADRSVRQAQNDFDYGQFLEARDWDINNLDTLLRAIGAVSGASGSLTKTKGEGTNWGAVGGALASAAASYYGSQSGGGTTGTTTGGSSGGAFTDAAVNAGGG